ncbi:MAG TPA: glycosyltransferase [Cryomorphaceae bacterium]|nr:glycosyltransferase [Cryomorphaceae bacterium]
MYILVLVLSLYFFFLLYALAPAADHEVGGVPKEIDGLSIVVPFRNEAKNLPELISSLEDVNFAFPVEFIFINDQSQDNSVSIVDSFNQSRIISTNREGKKFAILKGLDVANYQWALTLDADVKITQDFVFALQALDVSHAKMFLFALSPQHRPGPVSAFFDLEFIALQSIGIGMAQKENPILSNGACLLFEKKAFAEANRERTDYHIPTGDDIFGMFAIADLYGSHAIEVAAAYPLVSVSFPEKMTTLFQQRSRWISKTLDVPDGKYRVLAFMMGLIHLMPLAVFLALFFGLNRVDAVSLLFIKWSGEWIFFWVATRNFQRRDLLLFLPLSQLLYPIYTFALIVSGVRKKILFRKSELNAAG